MCEFYPLGYPVRVASKDGEVIQAASDAWGHWPRLFRTEPLHLCVEVIDGACPTQPPRFHTGAEGFSFAAGEANHAVFQYASRTAQLRISRAAMAPREWFRYHYLEALVLTALDSFAFTPVHAACVALDGRGVLLCGDSGAGKSSLAYACARAGWTFVSDDAVHVVSGGGGRIVGDPWRVHLRPAAVAMFPEMANLRPALQPNGKQAIEAPMTGSASVTAGDCIFLARKTGAKAALRDFAAGDARTYFKRYLHWGDESRQQHDLDVLLRGQPRTLEYERIDDAVARLEEVAS